MAFIVSKKFDWQEDLKNYKFYTVGGGGLASNYIAYKTLSWKGWLRRILRIRKPKNDS